MTTILETGACEPAGLECEQGDDLTLRELELSGIIDAYNRVTDKLKSSHEVLTREVRRLRKQIDQKDRELERRNRLAALGEMAAGVAHEIRNPLGGILLYATLLEQDLVALDGPRRLATKVTAAARKLDEIVGDILAFATQSEPKRRRVLLDEIVTQSVELVRARSLAAGCTVQVAHGLPGVEVEVDAVQFERALSNVIANAIDVVGKSGRVWIRWSTSRTLDNRVTISIADDGPGVPDALKDRIFNPFFSAKDSGTGLGLAIVHRIVESHDGRISVRDRENGGAVFTISIPLASKAGGQATTMIEESPGHTGV